MVFPHKFVGWAYKRYPEMAQMAFFGGPDRSRVVKYWEETPADDDLVRGHPNIDLADPEHQLPWLTYGDGVPSSKQGAGSWSTYVIGHKMILAMGAVLDTLFASVAMPSNIMAPALIHITD
jgi:hypothetical protein